MRGDGGRRHDAEYFTEWQQTRVPHEHGDPPAAGDGERSDDGDSGDVT